MQIVIDIDEDLYEGIERRDGALETEYVCDKLMKAIDNGTPQQNEEQEARWMPCSERLPKESITVIGITEFGDIYKAELYDDCGEKKWYADGNYDVPIVKWIPFPQTYKAN